jgi:hypothetical protein
VKIPVSSITIGERRRTDLGDIAGLRQSLREYGLIDPIVIQADGTLVHGLRRLTAVLEEGWREIEAVTVEALDNEMRWELERELDTRHKPLSEAERARRLVREVERVAQAQKEIAEGRRAPAMQAPKPGEPAERAQQVSPAPATTHVEQKPGSRGNRVSTVPERPAPARGPMPQPGSTQSVAAALGVNKANIIKAKQHVAALDRFPFMENWSRPQVLEAAKHLSALSNDERDMLVTILSQKGVREDATLCLRIIRNMASFPSDKRTRVVTLYRSNDPRERSLAETILAEVPPEPDPRAMLLYDSAMALTRAADMFPHDKYAPVLRELATRVTELKADIVKEWKERASKESA